MPPFDVGETIRVDIILNSNVGRALAQADAQITRFANRADRQLRRVTLANNALLTSVGTLARRYAFLAATLATTAATIRATRDAQRFGLALAEINTILDQQTANIDQVEVSLLNLARAHGLNETVAAKGFYEILSRDIKDAASANRLLQEASQLAIAGVAELPETVDLLGNLVKAYGVEISELDRVSSLLFATVDRGVITIPELAAHLGQVLPIAKALNVPLEELLASLATLTIGGIRPETAVIQLRQAFNQLLKPSNEALDVIRALGLRITPADIKTRGWVATLEELREKVGGNTAVMAQLFGNIRALIPVLALTGEGSEQLKSVLAGMEDQADLTAEAFDKIFDTPFKRAQVTLNRIRILFTQVGKAIIVSFDEAVQSIGGAERVEKILGILTDGFARLAAVGIEGSIKLLGRFADFVETFSTPEQIRARLDAAANIFRAFAKLVVEVALSAAKAIFNLLTALPRALTTAIQQNIRVIQNSPIASLFPEIEDFLIPTREELRERFREISSERGRLGREARALQNELSLASQIPLGDEREVQIVERLKEIGSQTSVLRREWAALREEFEKAPENFEFEFPSFDNDESIRRIRESFQDFVNESQTSLQALFEGEVPPEAEGLPNFYDELRRAIQGAFEANAELGDGIKGLLEQAGDETAVDRLFKKIRKGAEAQTFAFARDQGLDPSTDRQEILARFSQELETAQSGFRGFREGASEALQEIGALLRNDVVGGIEFARNAIGSLQDALTRGFTAIFSGAEDAGAQFANAIRQAIAGTLAQELSRRLTSFLVGAFAKEQAATQEVIAATTFQVAVTQFNAGVFAFAASLKTLPFLTNPSILLAGKALGEGGVVSGSLRRVRRAAAGYVAHQREQVEISEIPGRKEAVVPLAGNRSIPVEFVGEKPGRRGQGGANVTVNMPVTINGGSSDVQQQVLALLPRMRKEIAAALRSGQDRELELAIRGVA